MATRLVKEISALSMEIKVKLSRDQKIKSYRLKLLMR